MVIRVGRIRYQRGSQMNIPELPGFETIVVMMRSHCPEWFALSPYALRDKEGRIMENLWQFSKVYQCVPKSTQRYSRFDSTIIWQHPAETHVDEQGRITREHLRWRIKGYNNAYPVRYPVGYRYRSKCLYALWQPQVGHAPDQEECLDYVQSRKRIYVPVYQRLARRTPEFGALLAKHQAGTNLLIVEVDGPHQESMGYYQECYGVDADFIEQHTMEATPRNLAIMLNDTKHPFGHGYCLAMLLQNLCIADLEDDRL